MNKTYYDCFTIDSYLSFEEFIESYEDNLKAIKDKLPEKYKECTLSTQIYSDSDMCNIEVDVYRSETEQEVNEREEKSKKIESEKELKKIKLDLLKEDPEYIKYINLKEKFKDVDG